MMCSFDADELSHLVLALSKNINRKRLASTEASQLAAQCSSNEESSEPSPFDMRTEANLTAPADNKPPVYSTIFAQK
jgi:hypothetical protein